MPPKNYSAMLLNRDHLPRSSSSCPRAFQPTVDRCQDPEHNDQVHFRIHPLPPKRYSSRKYSSSFRWARLLNSPAKRVVLEADRPARTRQNHRGQAILEIPVVLRDFVIWVGHADFPSTIIAAKLSERSWAGCDVPYPTQSVDIECRIAFV
jgi:hypothetical protein